ncbi:hypothetical protein ACH4D3_32820 [Streptomyces sp. NPDC018026]|uniref:hypothetical protein n=1 Tax=Streptomyces sp. NPDC018026 TaxID=3365031 RepID=UPI0037A0A88C
MQLRRRRKTEESGPYWKQRSWRLSAGFLGLVLVLGGFVAVTADHEDTTLAAAEGPLSDDSVPPQERPRGCRTDDTARDKKLAPKDVTWRSVGGAQVPVSASAGPTRTSGPMHWCYAHTPVGAALAATVIPTQMSRSDWKTISRQQVVAGHGRDMFEFRRSAVPNIDDIVEGAGTRVGSYVGFTVSSYSSEAARVSLLIRGAQGFATTTIQLRWSTGDWKVAPADNGSLHTPVTTAQGKPAGYVLWGA